MAPPGVRPTCGGGDDGTHPGAAPHRDVGPRPYGGRTAWHRALSAEDAQTYKPAPALYEAAVAAAADAPPGGGDTPRPVMVAAHAWDLRAAARAGMRTAYVPRPGGDAPRDDDGFDLHARDLADLHARLLEEAPDRAVS